ncbi:unnamed protein product [Vitrella brassicaformis CCMP3155]|uniref:Uncharacterized protein n=1 Tax=Vitrella brassicaformis (strain CCMP3155) TaxID=1169540 RepID=A0A0G4GIW1_VITBC|nr:unnamed protein product [Vitrella brassicaformis CCMP3155]|eukprot:CEM29682.1 unnamed protein product [Vitrella brassicaformis CCMP3155]
MRETARRQKIPALKLRQNCDAFVCATAAKFSLSSTSKTASFPSREFLSSSHNRGWPLVEAAIAACFEDGWWIGPLWLMAVGSSPPTEQAVKLGFGPFNDGFGEGYFAVGEARRLPRGSWDLTQLAEKVQEARDLCPSHSSTGLSSSRRSSGTASRRTRSGWSTTLCCALEAIHEPPAMPHAKRELVDSATDAFYDEAAFHGLDAIVRPSPHPDAVSLYAGPFDGGKDGHFHIHDEARRRGHGELVDSATDAFYDEAAFHGLDAIVRPSPHPDAVSLYAGPFDGGKDGHFHIHDEARRRRHGWDFHDLKKRVDNLRNRSGGTPDPRHYGYVIMDHIRTPMMRFAEYFFYVDLERFKDTFPVPQVTVPKRGSLQKTVMRPCHLLMLQQDGALPSPAAAEPLDYEDASRDHPGRALLGRRTGSGKEDWQKEEREGHNADHTLDSHPTD